MDILLYGVIALQAAVIVYLLLRRRKNRQDLLHLCDQLQNIITENSAESLLVFDADKALIPLLVSVNGLLHHNRKNLADHERDRISMKKMLSNISHDLKTPLTVVSGYVETLLQKKGIPDAEKLELLQKVRDKTIEIQDLINRFFDLARLESGDKDIPLAAVDMNETVRKSILSFYDNLNAQGFDVILDIPEENITALSNEEAMTRILNNLITNAIRYGYEGKCVGLSLWREGGYVFVEVWDKGRGIDGTYRERIFDRMFTLEDSRSKLSHGSGLGLAITKRLTEAMGGQITLASRPYDKTAFRLRLNVPNNPPQK